MRIHAHHGFLPRLSYLPRPVRLLLPLLHKKTPNLTFTINALSFFLPSPQQNESNDTRAHIPILSPPTSPSPPSQPPLKPAPRTPTRLLAAPRRPHRPRAPTALRRRLAAQRRASIRNDNVVVVVVVVGSEFQPEHRRHETPPACRVRG